MDYKDFPEVESVYNIIIDYYGEDRVDIINYDDNNWKILIYFPKITVTNEYNKSIDITKLFTRIIISNNGLLQGKFTVIRSEYTADQYNYNYIHSHACSLEKKNLTAFHDVCLGTGPILATCTSLNINYDLNLWKLFCFELDQYFKVESIAGIPYKRLESVTEKRLLPYKLRTSHWGQSLVSYENKNIVSSFLTDKYYSLMYDVPYSIYKSTAVIGMSKKDFVITVSNLFIDWCNENKASKEFILNLGILVPAIIDNGSLSLFEDMNTPIPNNNSIKILNFKGKPYYLNVIKEYNSSDNHLLVLNPFIAGNIYRALTLYMNYGNLDKVSFTM